jgi:signal transduction histidine kinase
MPNERESLLEFFELSDAEVSQLAELRPVLEKHADRLVAAFYRHLLGFAETRRLLRDPRVTERLLVEQRKYLLSLAEPRIDEAYLAQRRQIGEVHERIGLAPSWYLGAYALYRSLLAPVLLEAFPDERGQRFGVTLMRRLHLDAALALETYVDRRERDLEYLNQQLAESGRQLAHDLETTGDELRTSRARAQAAERLASIGTLVAGLAHEIGTPMGVIQGHAKLLEPAVQDENARWRLRTIQAQISRISRIIESLLNMARPTRRSRVPVALAPLVDNTLAFLTEKLARRRVEVTRDYQDVPSVLGDPEGLQQLFLNLAINAADAMTDGGTLHVAIAPSSDSEAGVEVRVSDTGSGIPEAAQQRIFDPFFTTKEAGQGHGLGLAVAQGIAHDHGGEISLARTGSDGTEFRVLLARE